MNIGEAQPPIVPGNHAEQYTITRIGAEGISDFLSVWNECAEWLTTQGIEQWEPGALTPEYVAGKMARCPDEEWHVIRCEGELAGSFVLMWADPESWGEQPPDAGYVHALAVRRVFAGRSLGRAMLDWAGLRIARVGRQWLRLDCVSHNARLRAYYPAAGFTEMGPTRGEWTGGTLFQRAVSREKETSRDG